jgi:hypothetical protein
MPKGARGWNPIESRLLSEYLAVAYPDAETHQRVRVGALHPTLDLAGLTPEEQRAAGVWRRWADALVLLPAKTIIIETSVKPDPGKVSQLELYLYLFPSTPEYADRRALPVYGELVFAVPDPASQRLAEARGYAFVVYAPPWIDDYLSGLSPRNRRATLSQI